MYRYTEDVVRAANAITFTLLQDGIPITYYGQEQHLNGSGTPYNREALWSSGGYDTNSTLYELISQVNAIRTKAIELSSSFVTYKIETPYTDDHTIVTRKGENGAQIVGVYSNLGENGAYYNLTLSNSLTGFNNSQEIIEILSCNLLKTSTSGDLIVPMGAGVPKVLFPYSSLQNSTICPNPSGKFCTSAPKSLLYC
jgi:alpha-amylase